jgi:hypothetical protein
MSEQSEPTIRQALAAFLADTRGRVSATTAQRYELGIELFADCMDGYGVLDDEDDHRPFCDVAGPKHIPSQVGEFFGWFLVRKVVAPPSAMKACGTAVKQLAGWLGEQGYLDPAVAKAMRARAARGGRDLVRAQELVELLEELQQIHTDAETEEGHFDIERVERDALIVSPMGGGSLRLALPEEALELCEPGWAISGVLGRRGEGWELIEIWNVYP